MIQRRSLRGGCWGGGNPSAYAGAVRCSWLRQLWADGPASADESAWVGVHRGGGRMAGMPATAETTHQRRRVAIFVNPAYIYKYM